MSPLPCTRAETVRLLALWLDVFALRDDRPPDTELLTVSRKGCWLA